MHKKPRRAMKLPALLLLLLFFAACASESPPETDDRIASFVTVLGDDTLAVERFERDRIGISATVLLRTPRTTLRTYLLETDGFGNLSRYEATTRVPGAAADLPPLRRDVIVPSGDSLQITVTERGTTQTTSIPASGQLLPFIDMVHWPFELMLRRAAEAPGDTMMQQLFTGQGTMTFVVAKIAPGQMTIRHPYRGTMHVEVDSAGSIQTLDARSTTRKLVVHRVPPLDIDSLLARFMTLDSLGHTVGELSGRAQATGRIGGATIAVDYGQPRKRGREIFGGIVPYGVVWRTGANQATHLETNRPLVIGDLNVPAGTYTLFTIPAADGATLIINQQTGQTGTSHDPSRDLGRVPMRRATLPSPVEDFTIVVEGNGNEGMLRLNWDQTSYYVPVRVNQP